MYSIHTWTGRFWYHFFQFLFSFQKTFVEQPDHDSRKSGTSIILVLHPPSSSQALLCCLPPPSCAHSINQTHPDTWIYFSSFLTAPCSNFPLFSQGFNHTSADIQQASAALLQVKDILEGFYLYKVLQKLHARLLSASPISADKQTGTKQQLSAVEFTAGTP